MAEGAHVVEAVGQFDHDHPNIVDHGEEHFANALGLALLAGGEIQFTEFRHAVDAGGHFGTEILADFFDGSGRVLDDIVEEAGFEGDHVHVHVG
jgi:hypothetical protein